MSNYASLDDSALTGMSWEEVESYLSSVYKLEKRDNILRIILSYPNDNDRTQLVVVDHAQQSDRLLVEITSRVGEIVPRRLDGALEKVAGMYFVGLVKMGDEYYVRMTLNMNYTPLEEVKKTISLVGGFADDLEKEFVGGDEN